MDELTRLLAADRDFSALSVASGAAAAFKHYLIEEAILLPNHSQPTLGIDRIYHSMAGEYTLKWSPQSGKVSSAGDMGYTWGNYTNAFKNDRGELVTEKGKYLNIWTKVGNEWRVAVDMGNLS